MMKKPMYNKGTERRVQQMKNTKIIIIAASLVLAAALALCGCMYLIGEPPEETKEMT